MKLATFLPVLELPTGDDNPALADANAAAAPRVGWVDADAGRVLDLAAAARHCDGRDHPPFASMLDLLDAGPAALDHARRLAERALALSEAASNNAASNNAASNGISPATALWRSFNAVRWLAPVPRPRSLRDCLSFEEHWVRSAQTIAKGRFWAAAPLDRAWRRLTGRSLLGPPRAWRQRPLYYKGNPASVIGHEADARWPSFCRRFDFELEFGVWIGRAGRDIPAARAFEHVAGYSIFNDFSARDTQLAEMQGRLGPSKSKDFDAGNALGPWLTTRDEIADPHNLAATARVNGEEWTRTSTRGMNFDFAEIIAFVSRDETLHPGDFIAAGTLPGGSGLEQDRWLRPGDTVELEVQGLGVLRNRVRQPGPG